MRKKMGAKEILRVNNRTAHEIGVVFAEDEFSCVLVHRIGDVEVTEEWCTEKTGDIGIIHSIRCLW